MPSSDSSRRPVRIALRSAPYALPFAVGLTCLTWALTELVSLFTDAYGVVLELLPAFVVLSVGTGFVLFSGAGVLALVVRDTDAR
ncbi:MAG: hypothetical protein ABEJ73_01225 [Haloplanus sp.]